MNILFDMVDTVFGYFKSIDRLFIFSGIIQGKRRSFHLIWNAHTSFLLGQFLSVLLKLFLFFFVFFFTYCQNKHTFSWHKALTLKSQLAALLILIQWKWWNLWRELCYFLHLILYVQSASVAFLRVLLWIHRSIYFYSFLRFISIHLRKRLCLHDRECNVSSKQGWAWGLWWGGGGQGPLKISETHCKCYHLHEWKQQEQQITKTIINNGNTTLPCPYYPNYPHGDLYCIKLDEPWLSHVGHCYNSI